MTAYADRTRPEPGFDLYRQSLHLPEAIWSWLEAEAERTHRTRSDVATEALCRAMTEGDPNARD